MKLLATTTRALTAILDSDPSVTTSERSRILAAIRNTGDSVAPVPVGGATTQPPRIVRRREAAQLLSVSQRTIDVWAQQGILRKLQLPGHRRASGFRLSDIEWLVGGGAI